MYSLDSWMTDDRLTRVPLRYEVMFCRAPEDATAAWLESTLSSGCKGGPRKGHLSRIADELVYREDRVEQQSFRVPVKRMAEGRMRERDGTTAAMGICADQADFGRGVFGAGARPAEFIMVAG
ncbi:hypothetical protein G6O67_005003 [Ophiocordyceps sinensis]|uniref:Uncharacterized protein n=1 Tax=Ophiocordyceps sinensis TaxID=72228 RepID=A0A8H4PQS3_9HYPO|nr:hypothetical protein G6O67_005003 [Ophiocordyceps sinensis]